MFTVPMKGLKQSYLPQHIYRLPVETKDEEFILQKSVLGK